MINKGEPDSAGAGTGGLAATVVESAVIDATFDLFRDDAAVLVVELDAESRIARCNEGYLSASGHPAGMLVKAFPPDLLASPNASAARPCKPRSYPYLVEELWSCGHGGECSIRWFKLWACKEPATRFLKLGSCRPRSKDQPGYDDIGGGVQLQAFLDAAPDAIITINDQGTMVSANPATAELFGYERSELVGRNVSMLMPSPDHERHDRYIARYLETGEAKIIGIGRDIVALRKDGTTFPARLSVSEFESHGRRYFTGMLHDISERVDAEEQRRALFTEHAHTSRVIALGEMASGIAHEINQPLTAIVSFADASRRLIQTRRDDTDSLNRALRQISDQAQRAGDIIRRLRDFVKKKEPKRVPLDVNELIMAAVEMTSHDAERNGISLTVDFGTSPLHALVDRLQIEQVVLNLIRNSIDSVNESGGQDGSIEVRSGLDDGMAVIAVSDNGVGIKASELASVFKPFYTTKGKGTGLGLSISRSIAEAHDGELSLDADRERGAIFILRLPAHADG